MSRAGWQLERFHSTGGSASDPDSLVNDERAFLLLRSRRWLANITLAAGWHEESPEGWRWTERRFSFGLAPGPWRRVTLRFHLPEAVFAKTGPLTLTLAAGLGSYRAAEAGMHAFVASIPTGATTGHIECELDGCLPPSPDDARELGIVVTEVDCH